MASSVQQYEGITKSLDRFEGRIKKYRAVLYNILMNRSEAEGSDPDTVPITDGEVETTEALVRDFAIRVNGSEPSISLWEPLHPYCSKNEQRQDGWAEQNHEYFRWALLWVQKTRMYLEYLSGIELAEGVRLVKPNGRSEGVEREQYDVALSFAGEDREHARKIAGLIRSNNFSVFYDEYEQATLWGKNLYTHLSDLYTNKARFCLMFISSFYAQKLWTKREREAAQARAFAENVEYILPLRLDDTVVPGIEATTGYMDLRTTSHEEVVKLLVSKLRAGRGDA